MPAPLTDWRAGQPKSARHLNQLVDRARTWENIGGNVLVERFTNGTNLWAPEDSFPNLDIRPGIVSDPPSSGLAVSPPYCWVKYARPESVAPATTFDLELAPPPRDEEAGAGMYHEPYPVLVRVLGPPGVSAAIGTEGLMVQAWDLGTETDPQRPHWLFVATDNGPYRVRLTGFIATAAGAYNATLVGSPAADITGGSTITAAALGAAGTACIVVNASEINRASTSHLLFTTGQVDYTGKLIRVNSDGVKVIQIEAGPVAGEAFQVSVQQNAGSNGSASTACTYTYDVSAMNGQSLGTNVSVLWARPNGAVTDASTGLASYSAAGALILLTVNEVPDTTPCI